MKRSPITFFSKLDIQGQEHIIDGHMSRAVFDLFLLGTVLLYGVYLRVGDQAKRNFYVDELWRALEVINLTSFFDSGIQIQLSEFIFGRLGYLLLGKQELAFRLYSLCFSILALFAFARIAWRLFNPPSAIIGVFLFAVSNGLVEHAHEFKPYSFEVFLALLPLLLLVEFRITNERQLLLMGAVLTVIAVFATNIFPFFLFLVPWCIAKGNQIESLASRRRIIALAAFSLVAASIEILLIYPRYIGRLQTNNVFGYWDGLYLTAENIEYILMFQLPYSLKWYVVSFIDLLAINYLWTVALSTILFLILPFRLYKNNSLLALFILFPLVAQMILAALKMYPLLSRVSAFYFPYVILSLLYLIDKSFRDLKTLWPYTPIVLSAVLFTTICTYIIQTPRINHPGTRQNVWELSPALETLASYAHAGDVLILNNFTSLALRYYDLPNSNTLTIETLDPISKQELIASFVKILDRARGKTIWIFGAFDMKKLDSYPPMFTQLGVSDISTYRWSNVYLLRINN